MDPAIVRLLALVGTISIIAWVASRLGFRDPTDFLVVIALIAFIALVIYGIIGAAVKAAKAPKETLTAARKSGKGGIGAILLIAGALVVFTNLAGSALGLFPNKLGWPFALGMGTAILGLMLGG